VAVGDQVEMTSTSLSGTVFGTVSSIGLLSTSSGVASYPVVVDVTGDVSKLHDGVSVTAAIVYERRANVLAVPTAAVTTANGRSTVQKVDAEGAVQTVEVQVGETSGQLTEITSGLSEGDVVREVVYTRSATGSGTGTQRGYGGYNGNGGMRDSGGTGQFPGGFPGQGGQGGQGGQQAGTTGSRANG
jgi:macrolide-specific efflux system membrane fusion protein